ncbi:MAG: copper chaperone Copz family protein [Nitrospirae bacterium]|nr:copper chaperone Copz family protein [Nitrospirota bacterium]
MENPEDTAPHRSVSEPTRVISDRCPACGTQGRKVKTITLVSLLTKAALKCLNGSGGYRFCKGGACEIVYFHEADGIRFVARDIKVPVFQKSTGDSRTVCYCFEHTVRSIEEEVRRTGKSGALDSIAEKCRQGLDRCEELNPQGACCLGNVKQVVQKAMSQTEAPSERSSNDVSECCAPRSENPPKKDGGGACGCG